MNGIWGRTDQPPLVVAHRGASAAATENTLAAFRLAGDLGADAVELDVRRTGQRRLVVHHDPHLPDGRLLAELGDDELPESLPALADVFAATALAVNVEIKLLPHEPDFDPSYDAAAAVAHAVQAAGAAARVLVSSFDPLMVAAVQDHGLATALLTLGAPDLDDVVRERHVAVNPHHAHATAELVATAHERGLAVYPWTVDEPALMRALLDAGVDGLITNVPDVARAVVAERFRA